MLMADGGEAERFFERREVFVRAELMNASFEFAICGFDRIGCGRRRGLGNGFCRIGWNQDVPSLPNASFPRRFNNLPFPPASTPPAPMRLNDMSPTRTEINQANSQHSTGPKTAAGKQRSSLNALRHGLTGQLVVMPTEDLHAYQDHVKSFTDEYHPQGATEAHLVQALADTSWRMNRVAALETNILTLAAAREPNAVSDAPAEVQGALALASCFENQSKALANLSLHTQRLSRQFERTVAQLRDLQKSRESHENYELDSLLEIMEMFESKGEPYNPPDDGFVFSEARINERMHARDRQNLLYQARTYRSAA
jgi:hypothetical protein